MEQPERFKAELLLGLERQTKLGKKAWDLLVQRNVLDDRSIDLNPNDWIGHYTLDQRRPVKGRIGLGIHEIPEQTAAQLIFLDHQFKGDRSILYRFSHEISHAIGPDAAQRNQSFKHLFKTALAIREHGKGLSALGNIYREAGHTQQASEDLVELINMYLIDPDYFNDYLDYLSESENQERDDLGLIAIKSERVRDLISKSVREGVAAFFNQS